MLLFVLLCLSAWPAQAITLLRDAEIERGLKVLSRDILLAAGLNPRSMRIFVVDDASLNAFVINSSAIFVHSGLIINLERPEELQAVLAHEAAHIANGHLARRAANFQATRTTAGLGIALGVLAAAASDNPQAGVGIALGSSSTAQRNFLAHTRAEESSADQSAVRFLAQSGIDPKGAVDVLKRFLGQEVLNISRQDPYVRTHPLSRDRMRAMEAFAVATKGSFKTNPQHAAWFNLIQGKITAYTRAPQWTLRKVKGQNDQIALMRQAIAYGRNADAKNRDRALNRLLAKAPKNPFVHELAGDLRFRARDFDGAAKAYKRAIDLAPNQPLILAGYGRALLAKGDDSSIRQALSVLERARTRDGFHAGLMRDLAQAYARTGQSGMAALVTAERYALNGRPKDAAILAERATGLLPRGSGPWRRAMDVLSTTERALRKR